MAKVAEDKKVAEVKINKVRIKSLLDANIIYSEELTIPPLQSIVLEENIAKELLLTKYFVLDRAIGE